VTVTTVDDVFDGSTINGIQIVPVIVPEPAQALLLVTGALVLLGAHRLRPRRAGAQP
jgi:hypothetical protein